MEEDFQVEVPAVARQRRDVPSQPEMRAAEPHQEVLLIRDLTESANDRRKGSTR